METHRIYNSHAKSAMIIHIRVYLFIYIIDIGSIIKREMENMKLKKLKNSKFSSRRRKAQQVTEIRKPRWILPTFTGIFSIVLNL